MLFKYEAWKKNYIFWSLMEPYLVSINPQRGVQKAVITQMNQRKDLEGSLSEGSRAEGRPQAYKVVTF